MCVCSGSSSKCKCKLPSNVCILFLSLTARYLPSATAAALKLNFSGYVTISVLCCVHLSSNCPNIYCPLIWILSASIDTAMSYGLPRRVVCLSLFLFFDTLFWNLRESIVELSDCCCWTLFRSSAGKEFGSGHFTCPPFSSSFLCRALWSILLSKIFPFYYAFSFINEVN